MHGVSAVWSASDELEAALLYPATQEIRDPLEAFRWGRHRDDLLPKPRRTLSPNVEPAGDSQQRENIEHVVGSSLQRLIRSGREMSPSRPRHFRHLLRARPLPRRGEAKVRQRPPDRRGLGVLEAGVAVDL